MGNLDYGVLQQRRSLLRSSHFGGRKWFFQRPRSKLARFLLFEKVDYMQWICTAAAFFFVVVLFQAFQPITVVKDSGELVAVEGRPGLFGEMGGLDFGEGIKFKPSMLLKKFEEKEVNFSYFGRPGKRIAVVRPRLAMVFGDLSADTVQLQMVSLAVVFKEMGYDIEIYAFEDGPVHAIWTSSGFPVNIIADNNELGMAVDWSNYNGILVNKLEAKPLLSSLSQEPFRSLPVIWSIHEKSLALRLVEYNRTKKIELIDDWKQAFSRSTVVVFSNYLLTMMYSAFDTGNYYVIPGPPVGPWKANTFTALHDKYDPRVQMGYEPKDFLIAIVGSQFSYSGLFLERALILQAIVPMLEKFSSPSRVKVGLMDVGSYPIYNASLEVAALKLGFSGGSVFQVSLDAETVSFLGIADIVIYGSFLEEQYFPSILVEAMSFGKLVVAPDLSMIKDNVDDGVNGYIFPKDNIGVLGEILSEVISNGKLSRMAETIAYAGKSLARNLLVSEVVEGYNLLLESILNLPSEVSIPKGVKELSLKLKGWQWDLFKNISAANSSNDSLKRISIVDKLEEKWNFDHVVNFVNTTRKANDSFFSINWVEEKAIEVVAARKRLLEEVLKDRMEQHHDTWDKVYQNVRRSDRLKNELHERDDMELERTGQSLCIYEPYLGEGSWPFLHHTSLYRGVGLSRGRRRGGDDVDATARLPLLNNPYYQDIVGEHGAFFALANRIDQIHKNAWIGFQSWKAVARKASLTKTAENMLLEAIESKRHGDALYFWANMDTDPRNPLRQDFWSFCDALNAGNCRYVVSRALQRMYGVPSEWDSLPPMPVDAGSWSVRNTWVLPTRSFLEFVMFSRMFVDALDSQMYEVHHRSGRCDLSLTKDRHCYSRVLELLVNVWAYHSGRRIVYLNPETGAMVEDHNMESRKGKMWVKWFLYPTLKSMDEDLAEESDSDNPERQSLWSRTGEVFWKGVYERERNQQRQQKERKKVLNRQKVERIRNRARQKTIGKYIKPHKDNRTNATNLL